VGRETQLIILLSLVQLLGEEVRRLCDNSEPSSPAAGGAAPGKNLMKENTEATIESGTLPSA
jgi:hypothetical protein